MTRLFGIMSRFPGAEIGQTVTAGHLGEASRDQTFRENREAEPGERRGSQPAQATARANDAPGTTIPLKRGQPAPQLWRDGSAAAVAISRRLALNRNMEVNRRLP